jgi:plastocyanin
MSRRVDAVAVLGVLLGLVIGCGGDSTGGGESGSGSAAAPGQLGESTISGRVTFEGTAPPPARLRMDSDPLCMPDGATSELLLVGDSGGVQNVFVYVKEGMQGQYDPPADPVELDQVGCRYIPHVFGVQVGQPVHIMNSDPAVHNVNAVAKTNTGFNLIQQPKGPSATRRFERPEVMVPIRCEVHPWMNSWAGVVAHPFYSVSTADGRFELRRLPAGTYTIEAWHEQLGTTTQTVTVDGTSPATLDFSFKPRS